VRHKRNAVRHEKNASRHKRNAPRHIEYEVTFHLEHSILIEFQPNNEMYEMYQSNLVVGRLYLNLENKLFLHDY
jgi:hypothetical protein